VTVPEPHGRAVALVPSSSRTPTSPEAGIGSSFGEEFLPEMMKESDRQLQKALKNPITKDRTFGRIDTYTMRCNVAVLLFEHERVDPELAFPAHPPKEFLEELRCRSTFA
jgi:hypothetical protein